jgi:tetratricopeptide (TPR) repeat protein
MAAQAGDPLGPTFRAASDLFFELDRLAILEGEFFADDKRIAAKKGLKPDPVIRERLFRNIELARKMAEARLARNAKDADALFALCISSGLVLDYTALVEKRQLSSLTYLKDAQKYAIRLAAADPSYVDANMTMGLSEYLLGSLPFFVKWFVKLEGAEGDKQSAVKKLEKVVAGGRYLGPFAKILLSIIHLREKRYSESIRLLSELNRDFPENPLYRKELTKLRALEARR